MNTPSHIFRQAQYDFARGRSELVEDLAVGIIIYKTQLIITCKHYEA
jgi:hypothetical protein